MASELKEGKVAIASTLNELEERGYLMRDSITDEKGRFVDILYTFSDEIMPEAVEKYQRKHPEKFSETAVSPCPDKSCTENQDTDIQYTENKDNNKIKNNKISKNKILSDEISINQSFDSVEFFQKSQKSSIDKIDRLEERKIEMENVEWLIKTNIEYDWYQDFFEETPDNSLHKGEATFAGSLSEVDTLVSIIVNTICSEKEYIRIGKEDMPHSVVASRFKKLEMKHIEYALKCIMLNTKDIKNPVAYLTTVLYNASFTCDFAESNELKNLDPALFIPKQFHNDEFVEKYYEKSALFPKSRNIERRW